MDLTAVLVGVAILIGLVGIVVPILPGTPVIATAILVWAILSGDGAAWAVTVVALVLLAIGWSATYVLTGRRVQAAGVPTRSIVLAGLAGIVGFFVIPVVGLFLFFVGGLLLAEYVRLRDLDRARATTWVAVKATALGLVIELALALLAATTWLVAVIMGVGG
ncbi:DUF456 domain-containing protein [Cellulomonas bogoriensis]|uniref:Membrane protein n=1 Tax=Cellulomonas bogoriensis 69B4 = DSM 16987 TaxID=1386082 RepID=A0A0A0C4L2_9CELL|nr:DUF456 domain-containing protein [Cellulomonas bogoriensis]KGM14269.1 membrane protein [Cellulomonas bogoriensis 69B4 = DSM 16987]